MTKENAEIAANQNHSITNSLNFNHNPSYHAPIIPVGDIHRLQQDSPALADRIVGLLEKFFHNLGEWEPGKSNGF